jgi:general secretion pathway protein D
MKYILQPLIALLFYISAMVIVVMPLTSLRAQTQDGYTLAFVDADVRRVADAVLGTILNVNYTIDADVAGTITLRTSEPVPTNELIPRLEVALDSVDAVIIRRTNGFRILSRKNARLAAPLTENESQRSQNQDGTRFAPSTLGYSSEIITLEFADARNLADIITEFLGDDVVKASADGANTVIVTGNADQRDAAKRLIARFDIDTLAQAVFEIYRLENVDADILTDELNTIFQPPYNIIGTRVRLVPLPRLRSLLGIAAQRSDLARIEPWIKRLDSGISGKKRLYSYAVQNGRADDIAIALQQVLGTAQQAALSSTPQIPSQIGIGGNRGLTGGADTIPNTANSVNPQNPQDESAPRIVPNNQNNSLLIYADGEQYAFIREVLEKFDQPVSQVFIEATLAEVTLSDDLSFGVNFSVLEGSNPITTVTNSNTAGAVPASVFPGFSVSVIGSNASAVLNALESKTNVRVLSAPKLLTLNNQPATLQVGDQVPIITQQSQSVLTPGAPIVNNVTLQDTGVILQVTPRVNESGIIILDITQEVSDVATTTVSGIDSPTIQQRRLTSTVATRSGQMIALGGLIRNGTTRTKSGIPILSRLPIIGGLFGNQQTTETRTELIILLTPTVIRSAQENDDIVDALIVGLDLTRPLLEEARQKQVGGRANEQVDNQ